MPLFGICPPPPGGGYRSRGSGRGRGKGRGRGSGKGQEQGPGAVLPLPLTPCLYLCVCLAGAGSLPVFLGRPAGESAPARVAEGVRDASPPQGCLRHFRPTTRWSFGLVYLDYCSSLDSGFRSVEKCPREDIRALFAQGALDTTTGPAVLAITVANKVRATAADLNAAEDEGSAVAEATEVRCQLRRVVTAAAAEVGLGVAELASFGFEKTTVCVYSVAPPSQECVEAGPLPMGESG